MKDVNEALNKNSEHFRKRLSPKLKEVFEQWYEKEIQNQKTDSEKMKLTMLFLTLSDPRGIFTAGNMEMIETICYEHLEEILKKENTAEKMKAKAERKYGGITKSESMDAIEKVILKNDCDLMTVIRMRMQTLEKRHDELFEDGFGLSPEAMQTGLMKEKEKLEMKR